MWLIAKLKMLISYIPSMIIVMSLLFVNYHKSITTLVVQEENASSVLYFPSIVKPLHTYNVSSPAPGIISSIAIRYGDSVELGELLFTLKSSQLETTFRQILETYVKAKSAYQRMLFESTGNAELYRLGLISKIDYLNKQEQLKSNQLELWGSEQALKKIIPTKNIDLTTKIETMSVDKFEDIQTILQKPLADIQIYAPKKGILLFPSKTLGLKGNNKEDSSPVNKDELVQEGQILAVIADLSGLIFEVNVNETSFHNVTIGQTAKITGNAFPNIELQGTVTLINHQASNSESGDVPSYRVQIIVPKLTEQQRQIIQVGMSAEVALAQQKPPRIKIPITAVFFKNNKYWVKTINPHTQHVKDVEVELGDSDVSDIQITHGLTPGDSIVLPD